jgi:hypothetical protein
MIEVVQVSPLRKMGQGKQRLAPCVEASPSRTILVTVLADAVGEVVEGSAGQRDRGGARQHRRGSWPGHRILVDCCLTWSLVFIDLWRRLPAVTSTVRLEKGSLVVRQVTEKPHPAHGKSLVGPLHDGVRARVGGCSGACLPCRCGVTAHAADARRGLRSAQVLASQRVSGLSGAASRTVWMAAARCHQASAAT